MRCFLVVPDLHVPYHCPLIVKLISKIIRSLDCDGIVQLGDALDAFQISTYSKNPERRNLLSEDIEEWKSILGEWVRHLKPGANIHLLEGNHEHRLSRYIAANCRDIAQLVPDWPRMLGLDEKNKAGPHRWSWHPYTKWNSCRIGDCTFLHGFYFNQHVAATCLAKYRTNVVFGHTHRLQAIWDGTHYAISLGHASNEKQTAHQPTPTGWTQALGLLWVDSQGKTKFDIIPVTSGKAVVCGKTISFS